MIDVLVVEDSRVALDYLVYILTSDPEVRVIATASSGEEAVAYVQRRRPDIILMDIHMPGIDGFEATRQIMVSRPVPIVICTASTNFGDLDVALRSIEAGALTVVKKPKGFSECEAEADAAELLRTIKLMAEVKVVRRWNRSSVSIPVGSRGAFRCSDCDKAVVAIGASTGGPPVIMKILSSLPSEFTAPILIVQHISSGFVAGFCEWLATVSSLPVHVAERGVFPLPGHVYVAPDEHHLRVGPRGELRVTQDDPRNGLRPSVDVLFESVAEQFGAHAVGVLLTGMGRDGAEELKRMADAGALTIVQDEASCVVFGMPGEAIRLGAATHILPPESIAVMLSSSVKKSKGG